jgi:NSS family neurotransmitter:Na+ symporter
MAHRRRRDDDRPATISQWSSPWIFILAASGAAIGLKNVWQFPFLARQYGGGAFVIVYVLCALLVVLPLLIAEILLGRYGRQSPVNSMRLLAARARHYRAWGYIGLIGMLAGFLILSYLSVVAGWIMAYAFRMAVGTLEGLTADGVRSVFTVFVADPEKQLFWQSLFMLMTMVVIARGVKDGLEPVMRYAVPLLFALMLLLLVYAAVSAAFSQAWQQLLHPQFSKLDRVGMLTAMGHAFFSLGLGVGTMLMYGAYLQNDADIPKLAFAVVAIDTLAGIVGGLVVLAVLLSSELQPLSRPELLFQALPLGFDQLPWGRLAGSLFFVALVLASWFSGIGLIEPLVAWITEFGRLSRMMAAFLCGAGAWLLGVVCVLSFNYWSFSFRFLGALKRLGAFDLLQIITANVLLPISGMLISLYAGWMVERKLTLAAFTRPSSCVHDVWLWSVRISTPLLIFILLLTVHKLFL